jgi:hypothetical protein
MGKKRKAVNIMRRTAGLALALVLLLGGATEHVTVWATAVRNGDTRTSSLSGGGTAASEYDRYGTYIAVTPVYADASVTDVEDIAGKNTDDSLTLSAFFYTEEMAAQEEAELALPSQNQATLLFVSHDVWSLSWNLRNKYSSWKVWALNSGTARP